MPANQRPYYDHEPAYRRVVEAGGRGWDDACNNPQGDSYTALDTFLATLPPPPPGACALALGCGGGQDALRLAGLGYDVTGVDFAPSAIALARRNAAEAKATVRFEVANCLDLAGIESAVMDLVIDNHVLHCIVGVEDRRAFMASVFRVLKPGGLFFGTTMSREGDFQPDKLPIDPTTFVGLRGNRYFVNEVELLVELNFAGLQAQGCQRRIADPAGTGDELQFTAIRPLA
jgi:SAM-dependent methyltransferase